MELQGNLGGGFLLRNLYYNQITTSSTTDFGYQILCLKVKRGKKVNISIFTRNFHWRQGGRLSQVCGR
jgi:hypothetical protein